MPYLNDLSASWTPNGSRYNSGTGVTGESRDFSY